MNPGELQGWYSEGEVALEWISLNMPLHEPGKVRDRLAQEIKDVLRQFEEGTIPVTVSDNDLNPVLFCYEARKNQHYRYDKTYWERNQ